MDIYVDGANSTGNTDGNSKRAKALRKRGLALGGCGFSIVTEDRVVMKGFKCPTSSTLMETLALAEAIRMAKPGDTVHTDQIDLVDRLIKYGDTTTTSAKAAQNHKKRLAKVNVALFMARKQVNRALINSEGVNIVHYSSAEAKKQAMSKPERLVDRMAGIAAGTLALSNNVVEAIGNREVIVR